MCIVLLFYYEYHGTEGVNFTTYAGMTTQLSCSEREKGMSNGRATTNRD